MSKDYEVIKKRLERQATEVRGRADKLNADREALFGRSGLELVSQSVLRTEARGIARDLAVVDGTVLLGFNAHAGLKARTDVADTLAPFRVIEGENGISFAPDGAFEMLSDTAFLADFDELFKFFKGTRFKSFRQDDLTFYLTFGVGDAGDLRRLRFARRASGGYSYVDNAGHQSYPKVRRFNFDWTDVTREMHVGGKHPHISIEDELFVETIGGDLTIKLDDNTDTGRGIYEEPVDDTNQGLGDAEIRYARVGRLILLDILPFREEAHRYFVFNTLTKTVSRADGIGLSASALPNDSGVIFPGGYALGEGNVHSFAGEWAGFQAFDIIASPNGEDLLYLFFQPESDEYALMHFNSIRKAFATPMRCDGYALLPDGTLFLMRSGEPTATHPVQIFRSPFTAEAAVVEDQESPLANVGNADLVSGISDLYALIRMVEDQSPSIDVYKALKLSAQHVLDRHYWLDHDEIGVASDIQALIETAEQALASFERAEAQKAEVQHRTEELEADIADAKKRLRDVAGDLDACVELIGDSRRIAGELMGVKERRYADVESIEGLFESVGVIRQAATNAAVEVLLQPDALGPLHGVLTEIEAEIPSLNASVDSAELGDRIDKISNDVALLTDTVSALEFDDTVKRTTILERLGELMAVRNRVYSKWDGANTTLVESEGQAEFAVQLQLLDQTTSSIMSNCKDIAACDEGLARVSAQIEEIEQRFGALPKFFEALTERRESIATLFSNRRESLVQEATERAIALERAASAILPGIERRSKGLSPEELTGFFATDSSAVKVREIAETLREEGFSVRADDVTSKLVAVRDRLLSASQDRSQLFDGDLLKLGAHRFNVNANTPELATVMSKEGPEFHVTGTDYRWPIDGVVDQFSNHLRSETDDLYRAEYLAYHVFNSGEDLREVMNARLDEGYTRGIHDVDAQAIVDELKRASDQVGPMIWTAAHRAETAVDWAFLDADTKAVRTAKIRAEHVLGKTEGYLAHSVANGKFAVSGDAVSTARDCPRELSNQIATLVELGEISVAFDIAKAYGASTDASAHEVAAILVCDTRIQWESTNVDTTVRADGMVGAHSRIENGVWSDQIDTFLQRLQHHVDVVVPAWEAARVAMQTKSAEHAELLDLPSFEPKVMTGFVRNTLINDVYLPLIGNNFAKQLGSVTESGEYRSPSGGLLLMTSPPGYGKTTLMEYVAKRLGLMFVKVNGPSLGHHTLSLDPGQAPDASARREVEKVNLAFEFGNNVMLYIDDIQHCSSEFLQKFISLCDATRRVEGVFRGTPKTYDLRGKRFCVVMAGNPYTETGDRFEVPDMLANRADTYNLGDVLSGAETAFADSYIENAMGSNLYTKPFASDTRHAKSLIALAQGRDATGELDSFSTHEVDDATEVVRHLLVVRDVVSSINREYIRSAAVEANYRVEPPFLLQGSYRNFSKIAQSLAPVMTADEVKREIENHYHQEAQTLTSSSEFNLLKFARFIGEATPEQEQRFEEIVTEFKRRNVYGDDDAVSRIALPLATIARKLDTLDFGSSSSANAASPDLERALAKIETALYRDNGSATLAQTIERALARDNGIAALTETVERLLQVVERLQLQSGNAQLADALDHQLAIIETALLPLARAARDDDGEAA